MADPQPKPATAKELIGEQINAWGTFDYDRLPEEVLAETILSTLTAAGFRLVPPGWDVVKLESVATSSMTGNFGGQTIVPVVETVAWRVTERWDG